MPRADQTLASMPMIARPHRSSGPGLLDVAAVAVGGGIGSVARYALTVAFPAGQGFPWGTFVVNASGSFCLGLLVIYLLEVWSPHRFLRPFLAVGVLGGYTTFSSYATGVLSLLTGHRAVLAAVYALSSILAALLAVWFGMKVGRQAAAWPARLRAARSGGKR